MMPFQSQTALALFFSILACCSAWSRTPISFPRRLPSPTCASGTSEYLIPRTYSSPQLMIRIQKQQCTLLAARKKTDDFFNERPTEYWNSINNAAQNRDAERAESLLFDMPKLFEEGLIPTKPTIYENSMVLNAWSKSQSPEAPQRAEKILAATWKKFQSGEMYTKPNAVSYNNVINCWAKSRQQGSADRAEAILREMQERYKAGDKELNPDVITYNSVINAYATAGNAERAEALLEEMCNDFVNGNDSAKPNIRSFTTVLDAWANARSPDAPQ
jgi:pentatricopeptide repeat protein